MVPQSVGRPADHFECASRALGDIEQAVVAVGQAKNPQKREFIDTTFYSSNRTVKSPFAQLGFTLGILTNVDPVVLEYQDNLPRDRKRLLQS